MHLLLVFILTQLLITMHSLSVSESGAATDSARALLPLPFFNLSDIAFVHIPKTGGTFVEDFFWRALNVKFGRLATAQLFVDAGRIHRAMRDVRLPPCWKHHLPMNALLRFAAAESVPLSDISRYFSRRHLFAFVRHPYSRMVSEYKYEMSIGYAFGKKRGSGGSPHPYRHAVKDPLFNPLALKMKRHSPQQEHAHYCRATVLNAFVSHYLRMALNASRNTDATATDAIASTRRQNILYVGDCHLLPQSHFIFADDGLQAVAHVLKQENLAGDLFAFLQTVNQMQMQNISLQTIEQFKETVYAGARSCRLSADDLGAESKRLIREYYSEDFKHFGYRHF